MELISQKTTPLPPTNGKKITTYSMWSLFRNCRKACELRYLQGLVPLETDRNLALGQVVHEALKTWHETRDMSQVQDYLDRNYFDRAQEPEQKKDWHLATAMMRGYAGRYPEENFEVIALEEKFSGEIFNPATGAVSRTFVLAGKIDGLVKIGEEYFLLEHKTASQLNADYLERLWTDFQIILYSHYIEQTHGIKVSGVLYNILLKAKLQQSQGETEGEFETRRSELLAKSKTGKTTATRKMPESDEDFQARLAEKYADPEMFHREMLYLSRDLRGALQAELWELTQTFLDARRRGMFYQNTSFCFNYNRPCAYFPLCRSNGNQNVIENFYRHEEPHTELLAA
jgi:hypothetical protein